MNIHKNGRKQYRKIALKLMIIQTIVQGQSFTFFHVKIRIFDFIK